MPLPSKAELLKAVRQKSLERDKNRRDPDEFRCPQAKDKELNYYFVVLPELQVGDTCKGGGVCDIPTDLWFYENGFHFFQNAKYECPRIHDHTECPVCNMGFDLMKDSDNKEYRKTVSARYLARSHYAVNVYFINSNKNPEDLRGKVKWFNLQHTVWEKMDKCINSDDMGDKDEPKACGIFYHPWEGCYVFKLVANKKGDWNDYGESKFLPTSGPLVKNADGTPNDEAIQKILNERCILQKRFPVRNKKRLEELLAKLKAKETGADETIAGEQPAEGGEAPEAAPAEEPAIEEAVAEPAAQEVVQEEVAEPVAEPAAEEPAAEAAEPAAEAAAVEEVAEPVAPVAPVAPKAPPAKPAAAPAKPAAAKPAAKPATPAAKPATAAAATAAADDPELQSLLGAIHKSKK